MLYGPVDQPEVFLLERLSGADVVHQVLHLFGDSVFDQRRKQARLPVEISVDQALRTIRAVCDFAGCGRFVTLAREQFLSSHDERLLFRGTVSDSTGPSLAVVSDLSSPW